MDPKSHEIEAGSFRDRNGRIFYRDSAVLRALSTDALADWERLSETQFFQRLLAEEKLVPTERVEITADTEVANLQEWAGYLQHERIPFVSYPYEWSFSMLKDAGLLQLELLRMALDEDMVLKDASAFNVQWKGARPLFIDVPSIQRLTPGEPWVGYRQFCQMFLYPLFLQAYKDVAFHPWLRGSIDGIPVEEFARLMSLRDLLRPGVLKHVYLQAKLQSGYANTRQDVRSELRRAGFDKELIMANARGLSKLLARLNWRRSRSTWSHYATEHSYSDEDYRHKIEFVRDAVNARRRSLAWDLGCNTGEFSRIAAENVDYVVAMDADHLAIEQLYRSLKAESAANILPLVNNLADPSPALGWRLRERKNLTDRGAPELTLCLALIHHIVISANIPMREFLAWLASLGTDLIVEFVTRDDPMVQTLLLHKDEPYADYDIDVFEECLSQLFNLKQREELPSGTRVMYFARSASYSSVTASGPGCTGPDHASSGPVEKAGKVALQRRKNHSTTR